MLSLPSHPQLCQSERTSHSRSHFRTIERQDSFDLGCEPAISCGRMSSVTVVRPQPRTQSLDLSGYAVDPIPLFDENSSHIGHSTPDDLFRSCMDSTQAFQSTLEKEESSSSDSCKLINDTKSKVSRTTVEDIRALTEIISPRSRSSMVSMPESKDDCSVTGTSPSTAESSGPQRQGVLSERSEEVSFSSAAVNEGDSGIDPCVEGRDEGSPGGSAGSSPAAGREADASCSTAETSSKTEQRDKKKGQKIF